MITFNFIESASLVAPHNWISQVARVKTFRAFRGVNTGATPGIVLRHGADDRSADWNTIDFAGNKHSRFSYLRQHYTLH
jgi:hypothetical protein